MTNVPNLSNTEYEIMNLLRSREMYGLEMIKASPSLKRGTIYVTLDRMTDKGFVTSRAVQNPNEAGMPKRLYSVTALGQRVLHAREAAMTAFASGAFA
ncbi:PadR family transcriptional regulator [Mesorhizobium sp. Mes31]|uniref:PadR family transcriptional regulator n=1 Tax=Mesorhizobium sp. Mes31 TaxID=2926017 RepID=UPI002119198C|nr:PadR family transcriptional regulator [Mesorhizobium sp. Mes31]